MATLDVSSIEGFEAMDAAEQVKALLGMEIPDAVDLSQYVSKEIYNRKSTEAANLSKQLKDEKERGKARMSEDEQRQAEIAEKAEAERQEKEELRARIAELEKNNLLREHTLSFSGLGFEDKAAAETAAALVEGDAVKLFGNLKSFLESYKKKIEAEHLRSMSQPGGAGSIPGGAKDEGVEMAKKLASQQYGAGKGFSDITAHYKR